jgi:hypothetical protein
LRIDKKIQTHTLQGRFRTIKRLARDGLPLDLANASMRLLRTTDSSDPLKTWACKREIKSWAAVVVENKTSAMVGSSSPEKFFPGHWDISSAPSNFLTFFHKALAFSSLGSPEITTVRIAFGSPGCLCVDVCLPRLGLGMIVFPSLWLLSVFRE